MKPDAAKQDVYFRHLAGISIAGRIYKKYFTSRILYFWARRFGSNILEVGAGAGHGVLGAYPWIHGIDINSHAVSYCKARGLNAELIRPDGRFPRHDSVFSACILDNVLEHLDDPSQTLDECHRVTKTGGGLIVAVPGRKGFERDSDHKIFYDKQALLALDGRWKAIVTFSTPFFFISDRAANTFRQYCLVAVYRKVEDGRRPSS